MQTHGNGKTVVGKDVVTDFNNNLDKIEELIGKLSFVLKEIRSVTRGK